MHRLVQMMNLNYFKAPWGMPLIVVSALATGLCLGIPLVVFWVRPPTPGHGSSWFALVPVALVIGCSLYCIRGYTLTPDTLIIHRLLWQTRIPLACLQSAAFQPHAMRGSIRTFGNGGLFSFSGYYWSRPLGCYRAFVTDLRGTVILRFPTRTIVVSPAPAGDFVRGLPVN